MGSKQKHTPGPWRESPNTNGIISDSKDGLTIPGAYDQGCLDYYGGFLICESVSRCNIGIISKAPEMFDMLQLIAEKEPVWRCVINNLLEGL